MPRVSIMLPTYARNATGHLSAAIASVLAQTYRDFELIVVDDGSRDGSQQTIKDFAARDPRVMTRRFEQNIGLPALTTGLAFSDAAGEIIAWQFDDCLWEPRHLETLVAELDRDQDVGIAHGRVIFGTAGNEQPFGRQLNVDDMLAGTNHIPNVATVVRRSVYDRLGWVDPHILLKRMNDWEMWARACRTIKFSFVQDVLAREEGAQLSDSLGNSVSVDMPLVLRYSRHDRTETLRPANFRDARPFRVPPELQATREDLVFIGYLIAEHFIRIGRPADSLEQLSYLELGDPPWHGATTGGPLELYRWFMQVTNARGKAREVELSDFIQRQRQLLDDRAVFIEAQQDDIRNLQAQLRRSTPAGWLKSARDILLRRQAP